MSFATPVTLRGEHASLVPLALEHAAALADAARDGELWKLWYTSVPHADKMTQEIERRRTARVAEMAQMRDAGWTLAEIGKRFGISRPP